HQERPLHRECEVDGGREPSVGQVRIGLKGLLDLLDRSELHAAIVGRGKGLGPRVSSGRGRTLNRQSEGGGHPCIRRASSISRLRRLTRRSRSWGGTTTARRRCSPAA